MSMPEMCSLSASKLTKSIIRLYRHHRTDCYVISYPKCGRTWLRVMIAKALALHYKVPLETVFDPSDVIKAGCRKAPRIGFRHDGADKIPDPAQEKFAGRHQKYKRKRVIFLVRDPRDVVISYYFHRTRRLMEQHDLSRFVRDPIFGIDRIISFMNEWYSHKHIPKGFLLSRYEDLHQDPEKELFGLLSFIGIGDVAKEVIAKAVTYSSFDNMRRMSLAEGSNIRRIASTSVDDPESYKLRKGKVGGYDKYLDSSDIEYINERLQFKLAPVFGYGSSREHG